MCGFRFRFSGKWARTYIKRTEVNSKVHPKEQKQNRCYNHRFGKSYCSLLFKNMHRISRSQYAMKITNVTYKLCVYPFLIEIGTF